MTQIKIVSTVDGFNNVRKSVSKSILSNKKIYLSEDRFAFESRMAWFEDPNLVVRKPPNFRPLHCINPFTGVYFTTQYEAKEFISKILLEYECIDYKDRGPHWEINYKQGKTPVFSYFLGNKIFPQKSLYIKFKIIEFYIPYMKYTVYSLQFQAFKPSDYKETIRHKNNVYKR